MSENFYVPIFALSILLLLNTDEGSKRKNVIINTLLGASMALGYLTRYMHLVAIPPVIFLWGVKPLFNADPAKRKILEASRFFDGLAIISGFIITLLPWLIYLHYSQFSVTQGLGAKFVPSGLADFTSFSSLVLWIAFHVSYSILALAPFILILSLYLLMLTTDSIKNDRQETFFMITVILFSSIFLATATQHAWRAYYNYPEPFKIMGRYLIHLLPLWVIVFMIALNKVKNSLHLSNLPQIIFCSLLCLASIFYSLVMIRYIPGAQGLQLSFLNAPDIQLFISKRLIFFYFIVFISMAGMLAISSQNSFLSKNFILFFTAIALLVQTSASYPALVNNLTYRKPSELHGRALSQFIKNEIKTNDNRVIFIPDDREFYINKPEQSNKMRSKNSPDRWNLEIWSSVTFWLPAPSKEPSRKFFISTEEYSEPSIDFLTLKDYLDNRNRSGKKYLITGDKTGEPLFEYAVKGRNFYIYDADLWLQK
jgi:hypothetical protein